MITFLSKSFTFVAIFSIIRFLLGTYFASFILPTDYAVILVPMLMFAFLDIYVEGGYIVAIIKLGIEKEQKDLIRFSQLKNFLLFAPLLLLFFLLYGEYHDDKLLPIWVVLNYCFISFVKIYSYVREGILVARGKYVLVETLSFTVSMTTYALIFFLIFNTNLPGYYLLCLLHSIFVVFYTLLIFYFSRGLDFEKGNSLEAVNQFATTNRNVSLVLALNNRLDELAASNTLSPNPLGLFAKVKEMALGFGVITSKVITKPWFYVACNSSTEQTKKYYFRAFCFFCVSFLIVYPLCIFLIKQLIGIMGENWVILLLYDDYILVFLFVYFLCEFSRSTLLACEGEDFLFKLEKAFFAIRVLIYSLLLISSYVGIFKIEIITFIIIELSLRVLFLILENKKIIELFYKIVKQ